METVFRYGPFLVLAITFVLLFLRTLRTSTEIGHKAYCFGTSGRQRLAQWLFCISIASGLVVTGIHAAGMDSVVIWPLPKEGNGFWLTLAGIVGTTAGAVLAVFASSDMGRRWRVGVPDQAPDALVTTGLFRFSRNPVFAGMLMIALGLAVAVPADLMVLTAFAFWLACEMQVRDEEAFLLSAFGKEYADYMARVRCWF